MLAEKVNVSGEDRTAMTNQKRANACFKQAQEEYDKLFTLEFSRDRKSMSVYCLPKINKTSPLMFVKVHTYVCRVMRVGEGGGKREGVRRGREREEGGMESKEEREIYGEGSGGAGKDYVYIFVLLTGCS